MSKFNLSSGGTIEFIRTDTGYDVHVKNPDGDTVATLDMSRTDARDLMAVVSAEQ